MSHVIRAVLGTAALIAVSIGGWLVLADPGMYLATPAYGDDCGIYTTCPPTALPTIATTIVSPGDGGGDGGGDITCHYMGREIPCRTEEGSWYEPLACYISPVPQNAWPPAGDPIYRGADPESGTVWWCTRADWVGTTTMVFFDGPPPVDPTVLVWKAIARMDLQPIDLGTAPGSGPGQMGYIGLPTWMWVDHPAANTFGPITVGDVDGPVSITATARVTKVDWDMGDGTATVVCEGPGTPYDDSFGDTDSPDCGHRYEQTSADQPGGAYTVTATSFWEINWSASTGATGVVRLTRDASTDLRIGEVQVLVQ